jgi:hypothetical protein
VETLHKGRAAEAAVLSAFTRRNHGVLIPFGEGQPYDLAVDLGSAILRVQCKTGRATAGGLMFNIKSTDHGRGSASYVGLADVFGVYFPLNQRVYVVPVASLSALSCGKAILRLDPTLNNQKAGIRLAVDYELDRWSDAELRELAELSQRVEDRVCS